MGAGTVDPSGPWTNTGPSRVQPSAQTTGIPTTDPNVTYPGSRAGRMRAAYDAVVRQRGVPYLAANDPTLQLIYQVNGNLSPQQASWASQQAAMTVHNRGGIPLTDAELDHIMDQATQRGPGTSTQYVPMAGLGGAFAQAYKNLQQETGQSPEPNDPRVIAAYRAAAHTQGYDLSDEQIGQMAQQGANYWRQTGQAIPNQSVDYSGAQASGRTFQNPNQVSPAVWDSLGPVGQGLARSAAQSMGWDADEYVRQINATRPQGTAPKSSTVDYGGGLGGAVYG